MASAARVVIVGANLAGGRAAESLRKEGFDGGIVMIGEEPHRPYERPPMSKQVLRGEWPPGQAFLQPEQWYADNEVELMLGTRVHMIDLGERVVMAGGTLVRFDALLLATGGTPRPFEVPGATLAGVHVLRTMDDSLAIGAALQDGARVVVVGFGFIGAEVAASARARGCDVTILEASPIPLVRALGPEIGAMLGDVHRDNGVTVKLRTTVERLDGDGRVERVVLSDGTTLEADIVVVGIGITPNDELAREAGIACENGIVVNERCETSARGVFAAGDVANHPNAVVGERIRIEHWQNAQNQGAAAARAMLGNTEPFVEVPWFWSDQYDLNIQMAGHPLAWDRIVYRGDVPGRTFAAFYMNGSRIAAVVGFNRGKDVRGSRGLIEARADVADDPLRDDTVDLRALAKTYTSTP